MLIRHAVSSMLKGEIIECVTFSNCNYLYSGSLAWNDSEQLVYFQIESFGEYYEVRHFDYKWSKWNKINIIHILSNIEGFAKFLSSAKDKDTEKMNPMMRWT